MANKKSLIDFPVVNLIASIFMVSGYLFFATTSLEFSYEYWKITYISTSVAFSLLLVLSNAFQLYISKTFFQKNRPSIKEAKTFMLFKHAWFIKLFFIAWVLLSDYFYLYTTIPVYVKLITVIYVIITEVFSRTFYSQIEYELTKMKGILQKRVGNGKLPIVVERTTVLKLLILSVLLLLASLLSILLSTLEWSTEHLQNDDLDYFTTTFLVIIFSTPQIILCIIYIKMYFQEKVKYSKVRAFSILILFLSFILASIHIPWGIFNPEFTILPQIIFVLWPLVSVVWLFILMGIIVLNFFIKKSSQFDHNYY